MQRVVATLNVVGNLRVAWSDFEYCREFSRHVSIQC
jgi:hypothetical protein